MHDKIFKLNALMKSLAFLTLFNAGILLMKLPLIFSGICIVLGVTGFKYLEIMKRLYCYNVRERSRGKLSSGHSCGGTEVQGHCLCRRSLAGIQAASPAPSASSTLPIRLNKASLLTQYHLTHMAHNFEERVLCFAVLKHKSSLPFSNNLECCHSYL